MRGGPAGVPVSGKVAKEGGSVLAAHNQRETSGVTVNHHGFNELSQDPSHVAFVLLAQIGQVVAAGRGADVRVQVTVELFGGEAVVGGVDGGDAPTVSVAHLVNPMTTFMAGPRRHGDA